MKWNYKKCNVTITVNYESLPMISLMPVVEIDCGEDCPLTAVAYNE